MEFVPERSEVKTVYIQARSRRGEDTALEAVGPRQKRVFVLGVAGGLDLGVFGRASEGWRYLHLLLFRFSNTFNMLVELVELRQMDLASEGVREVATAGGFSAGFGTASSLPGSRRTRLLHPTSSNRSWRHHIGNSSGLRLTSL